MRTGTYDLNQSIMAVGAHADDIEIEVGGTLEKYFQRDYEIVYVMSTNNMSGSVGSLNPDGSKATRDEATTDMIKRRKRECDDAAREWNTSPIHLDHPQRHYTDENLNRVELRYGCPRPANVEPDVPTIITAFEHGPSVDRLKSLMLEKNPEVIFTHGALTKNPEHFCTTLLVTNAYWAAVQEGFKGALLLWREVHTHLGPAEIRWDTFIDYSPYVDRKMELIGKHVCQMPQAAQPTFGHRVVAQERGKSVGCGAAEVFTWVKSSAHYNDDGPVYGSLMMELINNSRS